MPKRDEVRTKSHADSRRSVSQQNTRLTDYFQVVKGEKFTAKNSKSLLNTEVVTNEQSSVQVVETRTRSGRNAASVSTSSKDTKCSETLASTEKDPAVQTAASKGYVVPQSSPYKRVRVREPIVANLAAKEAIVNFVSEPVAAPSQREKTNVVHEQHAAAALTNKLEAASKAPSNSDVVAKQPEVEAAPIASKASVAEQAAAKNVKTNQASNAKAASAPRRLAKDSKDVAELKKRLALFESRFQAHAANAERKPDPQTHTPTSDHLADDHVDEVEEPSAIGKVEPLLDSGLPAFHRFAHLAEAEDERKTVTEDSEASTQPVAACSTRLSLPSAFERLAETFTSVDTVSMLLYNRDELCTFEKLKMSVQRMTRREFDRSVLRRIRRIMPKAYSYYVAGAQHTGVSSLSQIAGVRGRQLVVEPNLEDDGTAQEPSRNVSSTNENNTNAATGPFDSPTKTNKMQLGSVTVQCPSPIQRVLLASPKFQQKLAAVCPSSPTKPPPSPRKTPTNFKTRPHFSLGMLRERKRLFDEKLLELLHSLHRRFLTSLPRPVELDERSSVNVKRWHPMFELTFDKLDVEPVPLPDDDQQTDEAAQLPVSAKRLFEVYERRTNAAYADALRQVRTVSTNSESTAASTASSAASSVKGIPQDILERVRERERARKLAETKEKQQAHAWLAADAAHYAANTLVSGHLEEVVRFLWTMFTSAQKSALEYSTVTKTMRFSRDFDNDRASCVSLSHVEQAIDFICERSAGWLQKLTLSSGIVYLKLTDRSKSVAQVVNVIQSQLSQLSQ